MNARLAALLFLAALAGAIITFAFTHHAAPEESAAPAAPERVSIVGGEPTVALDAATQREIGIVTARVGASARAEELELFGTVLDVQELAALESQSAAARAQLEQAGAKAAFDRPQLARLKTLNADNRNVSDRAVQEAASALAADEAAIAAANAAMRAASVAGAQRFGPAIGPHVPDLLALRKVLIQFTIPGGARPPQSLRAGDVEARLLSPAPRVDPKLQGASYLYLAPAGALAAGMNVTARYAGARTATRPVVPPDAVVSWQGRSWVYVRRSATQFSRRELGAIASGDEVVVTGAQQLLGEEMRGQLHEE